MQGAYQQQEVIRQRTPFIIGALLVIGGMMILRLASFQFPLPTEVQSYLESLRDAGYRQVLELAADRGLIYDRNGEPLAVNTLDYRIGISPNLISDPRRVATQLAAALGGSELEIFQAITRDVPWVQLAPRVSASVRQQIAALGIRGITMNPIPRRRKPHGYEANRNCRRRGEHRALARPHPPQ